MDALSSTLIALATALLLSLTGGMLAARVGIPRVTVYLLAGFVLGPHGLGRFVDAAGPFAPFVLGEATNVPLEAVEQLTIGFILFGIGDGFRFDDLRRVGGGVALVSGCEIGLVALLVGAGVYLVTGDPALAVVAPALAISTAPSATLVTLREVEAEGPASRMLILCVGLDNLAALLLFPLVLAVGFGTGGALGATAMALGALVGGGLVGLVGAALLEAFSGRREQILLAVLVVAACVGGADHLAPGSTGLAMLACLGAGVALTNGSPHGDRLQRWLENTVYPLYVVFFIAAGRHLHVDALATLGMLGLVFVLARSVGKVAGMYLGARMAGLGGELPPLVGAGLLCQAGVALGLVDALEAAAPEASAALRTVVVGSVVCFELGGPLLVRQTVIRAGEVKLANLLPDAQATTPREAVRWVGGELRRSLGMIRSEVLDADRSLTVAHAMRRRPDVIREDASFERVLKRLGQGRGEMLPVVDADDTFKGVISYHEVKSVLYDPALRDLVIAGDLATHLASPLSPDASAAEALERMDAAGVSSWPVVAESRLVGMVRRPDVYAIFHGGLRRRTESSGR